MTDNTQNQIAVPNAFRWKLGKNMSRLSSWLYALLDKQTSRVASHSHNKVESRLQTRPGAARGATKGLENTGRMVLWLTSPGNRLQYAMRQEADKKPAVPWDDAPISIQYVIHCVQHSSN